MARDCVLNKKVDEGSVKRDFTHMQLLPFSNGQVKNYQDSNTISQELDWPVISQL